MTARTKKIIFLSSMALVLLVTGARVWDSFSTSQSSSDEVVTAVPLETPSSPPPNQLIQDTLKKGETLASLFSRYNLSAQIAQSVTKAAKGVLRVREMKAGNPYELELTADGTLKNFVYTVDDFSKVVISQDPNSPNEFVTESVPIVYNIVHSVIRGTIEDSLFRSLSDTLEPARLAIDLSEIFGWDIDFNTDLQKGATYEMLVEERWLAGSFVRYGRILAARLTNDGESYQGYFLDGDRENAGYYDEKGRPLKRGFLSSPLRYKYISSKFTMSRYHPVLKIRRPHLGVDYAAPTGTPVSAASSGAVKFAGREGGFGKLVILRHASGYETYYGHLSAIKSGVRTGAPVVQGDVIGYVGSTGLSTGPHLDYRVSHHGRFMDPLKLKAMKSEPLAGESLAKFKVRLGGLSAEFKEARYAVTKKDQKTASLGRLSFETVASTSLPSVSR